MKRLCTYDRQTQSFDCVLKVQSYLQLPELGVKAKMLEADASTRQLAREKGWLTVWKDESNTGVSCPAQVQVLEIMAQRWLLQTHRQGQKGNPKSARRCRGVFIRHALYRKYRKYYSFC